MTIRRTPSGLVLLSLLFCVAPSRQGNAQDSAVDKLERDEVRKIIREELGRFWNGDGTRRGDRPSGVLNDISKEEISVTDPSGILRRGGARVPSLFGIAIGGQDRNDGETPATNPDKQEGEAAQANGQAFPAVPVLVLPRSNRFLDQLRDPTATGDPRGTDPPTFADGTPLAWPPGDWKQYTGDPRTGGGFSGAGGWIPSDITPSAFLTIADPPRETAIKNIWEVINQIDPSLDREAVKEQLEERNKDEYKAAVAILKSRVNTLLQEAGRQ